MKYIFASLLFMLSAFCCAQGPGVAGGLPFIQNFTPKQYNANTQNWAIVQDQQGLMYFGNNKGVLEYDGVNWRLIPVSNHSVVRSLAIDSEGTIYVGASGEFGYLAPDSTGAMAYQSLVPETGEEEADFTDVWTTLIKGDEVFFQTSNRLFRAKEGKIKSWPLRNSYHRSFLIYDKVYLREEGHGLMVLEGDSLHKIPNGELFKEEVVSAMLPYKGNILIGSRNKGLFLYDLTSARIRPFMPEPSSFLGESLLYHGVVLANGDLAFSTIKNGLIVYDQEGNRLLHLNQKSGLLDKIVFYLYPDKAGSLWLGLANGISKVEVGSPLRVYNELSGLEGGVLAVTRFKGTLYTSNNQGVFYLNDQRQFVQVKNLYSQCWQMEEFKVPGKNGEQKLLVATRFGVYEVEKDAIKQVTKEMAYGLKVSATDSSRVFIGQAGFVSSVRYEDGQWVNEGTLQVGNDEIRKIQEDQDGNLWLETKYNGILSLKVKDWVDYIAGKHDFVLDSVKRYATAEGLPSANGNGVFSVQGKLLVGTPKGIFKFNRRKNGFEKAPEFEKALGAEDWWIFYLEEDEKGRLWFDSNRGKGVFIKNEEGYTHGKTLLKRINVSSDNDIGGYADEDGVIWFGTPDGLFRYDSKLEDSQDTNFQTLIRNVIIGEDSVIFNGNYSRLSAVDKEEIGKKAGSANQQGSSSSRLAYTDNSLSFHFAASAYHFEGSNQFSYYLQGYDKQWSGWTRETKKEYTNLPEGKYTFRVKAKNLYDNEGKESFYKFAVLPPWYRTQPAYFAYVLAFILAFTGASRLYANKFKKDNLRLETVVQRRTAEIEEQKNQIEKSYQNVTTLSQIGQNITASLDFKSIHQTLYKSINTLMDASSFGVGLYNEEKQSIDFQGVYEEGKELQAFSNKLTDDNRLAVWCFKNQKEILISEREKDYKIYLPSIVPPVEGRHSESVIYIPLQVKEKKIGVITVQSYTKYAYQPYHLDILRTLAAYTAIAIDNSSAYLQVNEINEELSTTLEHLKQTQAQLVQSEKMASLGQLTAGVAHEINNPINFVSAGIDSLAANYADLNELLEKVRALRAGAENTNLLEEIDRLKEEIELDYILKETPELLNGVKTGAKRTAEIVRSLKNFTRLDEESLKMANLQEGLDSTLVILRNQLNEKTRIVKEYEEGLPLVHCYPGQLNQVFMNILNNAIQALEGEGEIRIATALEGKQMVIRIKDSGKGMSAEVQQRIFEPFFTTKDVGEGTGLGLSISYSIIEKHKGKIEVASIPGEGTEFIIRLPINLN